MFKMFNRRLISVAGCPVRAPGRNAPLVRLSISALYILFACLYRMLPHLSLFTSLFPYLSHPFLVFSSENRPAPFPGRMSKKATKPASVFLCLFCAVVHVF